MKNGWTVRMDITGLAAALLLWFAAAAGRWCCFEKMGCQGWAAMIPLYSSWLLFHELYGNGWGMLYLLLPFYNLYFFFRHSVRLAFAFNRSAWFGVGLALLPFVFFPILGFGRSIYLDGSAAQIPEKPLKTMRL